MSLLEENLEIRFDFTTEQKVKDFFENARKYLTNADNNDKPFDDEKLITIFGNTTNTVHDSFTNFIDRPYFEDWLDIAELILENDQDKLSDLYLRFVGDIGKDNFLEIVFLYDNDIIQNNIQDILVQENIKTYSEFTKLIAQEINVLKYLRTREIPQNDVLNIEQIRKDILFKVGN